MNEKPNNIEIDQNKNVDSARAIEGPLIPKEINVEPERQLNTKQKLEALNREIQSENVLFSAALERAHVLFHFISENKEKEKVSGAPLNDLPQRSEEIEMAVKEITDRIEYLNQTAPKLKEIIDLKIANELGQMFVRNASDAEKMNAVFGDIALAIETLTNHLNQIPGLKQKGAELNKRYKEAKLRENNFENFEAVEIARRGLWSKRRGLQNNIFKRWKNRKEIAEIRLQADDLNSLRLVEYTELFQGYRFTDLSYAVREAPEDQSLMATRSVVNRLLKRSDDFFEALRSLDDKEQLDKKHPILDEKIIDSLNNDFIEKYVEEAIKERKKRYTKAISGSQEEQDLDNNAGKIKEIIKHSYALPMGKRDDWQVQKTPEIQEAVELHKSYKDLPYDFHSIIERFINRGREPSNDIFHNFASAIKNNSLEILSSQNEAKSSYANFIRKMDAIISGSGFLRHKINPFYYDVKHHLVRLEGRDFRSRDGVDEFIKDLDAERWEIFKANPEVLKLFSPQNIEKADSFLSSMLVEKLVGSKEHTDDSVKIGQKLLSFKNPAAAPIAVLNAYREPGYSGEYPFLRDNLTGGPPLILAYLNSLDAAAISHLQKQEPEMVKIIELMRESPETFNHPFNQPSIRRSTESSVPNPIYTEINRLAAKLGTRYLKKDDPAYQRFILSVFKRLSVDLGDEAYQALSDLRSSSDEKTFDELIDCCENRMRVNDCKMVKVLIDNFENLGPGKIAKIKYSAAILLSAFIEQDDYDQSLINSLAKALEKDSADLNQTVAFLKEIRDVQWHSYAAKQLDDYIALSKNPQILTAIKELAPLGYMFDIKHASELPYLAYQKDAIISDIQKIAAFIPEFKYSLIESYHTKKIESDPYSILARVTRTEDFFYCLAKGKDGIFQEKFTQQFMRFLREEDPLLQLNAEAREKIAQKPRELFSQAVQKIVEAINNPESSLVKYREYFSNAHCLRFLARQPERIEEVLRLPEKAPRLFNELFLTGGPLAKNLDNVFRDIFSNGDAVRRAKEIEGIFTKKVPYWRQLFLFTDMRIGQQLASSNVGYPIDKILGAPLSDPVARYKQSKAADPDKITRLESVVKDKNILDSLINGEINSVPFSALNGIYKRVIFRDYLKKTIETSQSPQAKSEADYRNRAAGSPLVLKPDNYIHGSAIDNLDAVLLHGNLPQEALGEGAATDSYPFNVDFTKLEANFIQEKGTVDKILKESLSGTYGQKGILQERGQIFYCYDRQNTKWEPEKSFTVGSSYHALMLGGIPATEISAIVLSSPEDTLERAKRSVLENGFYISLYDLSGNLLFAPDEYDNRVLEFNLKVPVENWEYSLKTGGQKGSNPGAEFTVLEKRGPQKYYVKFAGKEETDSIWNEKLADDIYKVLGAPVPETKIVKVEGNYGHASLLLEGQHMSRDDIKAQKSWNDGFIADALLANWDIPSAPERNTFAGADNKIYRIDNGGALLFRARGERKNEEAFGAEVKEIGASKDHERFGLGSRQEYPDLTGQEIKKQAGILKDKLTDATIDRLVDGVRLSQKDRDYLKRTLKARRDFIIEKFA